MVVDAHGSEPIAILAKVRPAGNRLPHQAFRSDRGRFISALVDIAGGLTSVRTWTGLAWEDFIQRYRRSYVGMLWATLSFMIFAFAVLFFVAALRQGVISEAAVYILFGFLFFQLLSIMINDGAQVFIHAQQWIRSVRLPLSLFALRGISRTLITFLFNGLGAALILIFYGYRPEIGALWAIPGLFAVLFTAYWLYLLLGTVVTRYRDVGHAIEAVMRMSFFVTPIMWEPPESGLIGLVAQVNPLTHYLAIMREPFLHGTAPVESWMIVGAISAIVMILGFGVFTFYRKRIILWL